MVMLKIHQEIINLFKNHKIKLSNKNKNLKNIAQPWLDKILIKNTPELNNLNIYQQKLKINIKL